MPQQRMDLLVQTVRMEWDVWCCCWSARLLWLFHQTKWVQVSNQGTGETDLNKKPPLSALSVLKMFMCEHAWPSLCHPSNFAICFRHSRGQESFLSLVLYNTLLGLYFMCFCNIDYNSFANTLRQRFYYKGNLPKIYGDIRKALLGFHGKKHIQIRLSVKNKKFAHIYKDKLDSKTIFLINSLYDQMPDTVCARQ